jgi:hypothetical protein
MKFSEWTKRTDSHVIDNAAGDHYERLPQSAKDAIDSAVERYINFLISKEPQPIQNNFIKNFNPDNKLVSWA